jgi:AcrR family transcriptional regulator
VAPASTVRAQSCERSLDAARSRAEARFERLVDAAYELTRATGRTDFTLQDVAARARVSLRTFYQHFASREELLLAVFEHGITTSIPVLTAAIERETEPVAQLRAYVDTLFSLVFADEHLQNRPLTTYHLHLAQTSPEVLARVLGPRNEILIAVLQRGIDAGEFRDDIEIRQLAMLLSQTIIAALHSRVLGTHVAGAPLDAGTLWTFCLGCVLPLSGRRA